MALDMEAIRADFPILSRKVAGGKDLVYLDNAATTQKPQHKTAHHHMYYILLCLFYLSVPVVSSSFAFSLIFVVISALLSTFHLHFGEMDWGLLLLGKSGAPAGRGLETAIKPIGFLGVLRCKSLISGDFHVES